MLPLHHDPETSASFQVVRFSRVSILITSNQLLVLSRERRQNQDKNVESRPQESGRSYCDLLTVFTALLVYFWHPAAKSRDGWI